jgi:hypothetical protein
MAMVPTAATIKSRRFRKFEEVSVAFSFMVLSFVWCEEMAKRKESVNFHRQKQLIDIITVVFYFDLLSRRYARKYFY